MALEVLTSSNVHCPVLEGLNDWKTDGQTKKERERGWSTLMLNQFAPEKVGQSFHSSVVSEQ